MKKTLILALATLSATAYANNPYIHKVYDFRPAPGQYVNVIPEYEAGDTHTSMVAKCEEYLKGTARGYLVSLGAYGGYIIFGFDHPLVNVHGKNDLKIYGNAFRGNETTGGGSCEPGIVMVSVDVNSNGLPDDPWYELAGSEYSKPSTMKGYTVTYSQPAADRPWNADPDPQTPDLSDRTYIPYSTNDPAAPSGYVQRNKFHTQDYWPQWLTSESTLQFSGTRLAPNAHLQTTSQGVIWVMDFLPWGYADNVPNDEDAGFNLDNAVDAQGNPVSLNAVDFIKVYTGNQQAMGALGEASTELMGAQDLHPDEPGSAETAIADSDIKLIGISGGQITLLNEGAQVPATLLSIDGRPMMSVALPGGTQCMDCSALPAGVYLLRVGGTTLRILL